MRTTSHLDGRESARADSPAWRSPVLWVALAAAVLAFLPRALTAGEFQTVDEVNWMERSFRFSDAIADLDPASMTVNEESAATMPGVTTMWLGTLARGVWRLTGDRPTDEEAFVASADAVELTQLAVALATSLLIGLIVALAWGWAGPIPAASTGALLASEPFIVAHGAVLHTDELAALFAAAGYLALLRALGWPRGRTARPAGMATLGGALLAGAFLTKISALALAPGLALVLAVFGVRAGLAARRAGASVRSALGEPLRYLGVAALAGLLVIAVLWPAIWADPGAQIDRMRQSAELAKSGHLTFFLGDITTTPGPLFYAVATPFRMTPWFLIAALGLAPLAFNRRWRAHVLVLLAISLPVLATLSLAAKQADRYVLIILPCLVIAVGLGVDVVVRGVRRRLRNFDRRKALALGIAAVLAIGAHAVAVAPWGLAYYNPLLGGGTTAEDILVIGWGEGIGRADERIRQLEHGSCGARVAVLGSGYGYANIPTAYRCTVPANDGDTADYLMIYANIRQRTPEAELAALRAQGRLVATVEIRGINYAEIYDLHAR